MQAIKSDEGEIVLVIPKEFGIKEGMEYDMIQDKNGCLICTFKEDKPTPKKDKG